MLSVKNIESTVYFPFVDNENYFRIAAISYEMINYYSDETYKFRLIPYYSTDFFLLVSFFGNRRLFFQFRVSDRWENFNIKADIAMDGYVRYDCFNERYKEHADIPHNKGRLKKLTDNVIKEEIYWEQASVFMFESKRVGLSVTNIDGCVDSIGKISYVFIYPCHFELKYKRKLKYRPIKRINRFIGE